MSKGLQQFPAHSSNIRKHIIQSNVVHLLVIPALTGISIYNGEDI